MIFLRRYDIFYINNNFKDFQVKNYISLNGVDIYLFNKNLSIWYILCMEVIVVIKIKKVFVYFQYLIYRVKLIIRNKYSRDKINLGSSKED